MLRFRSPVILPLLILALVLVMSVSAIASQSAAPVSGNTLEGWFSVIYGDGQPGFSHQSQAVYRLSLDNGQTMTLAVSQEVLAAAGGALNLQNQRVQVTTAAVRGTQAQVTAIQPAPLPLNAPLNAGQHTVSGSQPWVTIMCAFPGSPTGAGTQNLNYFQNMYGTSYGGIDHYWRQQSFGKVDLIGSQAYGWFSLPHPQTYYAPHPGNGNYSDANLDALQQDCVAAADATVNFAPFVGINMMFNGDLDCCAWGGGNYLSIDGSLKLWRLTWNPPWSWADVTVVAHEVGHGFGLPHANNYDNDGWPYDSPWDVMSDTWSFCNLSIDPTYGCLGQHTNSFYKDYLGWIDNANRLDVDGSTGPINLDNLAMQDADDYQILIIPVPDSTSFYVVEARQGTDQNYDVKLPGKAVIIWQIDFSRQETAWQVGAISDSTSQTVSSGPDGAWLPGESFAAGQYTVTVESETADGFVVSVTRNQLLANGGMEVDSNRNKLPDGWIGKNLTADKMACGKPGKVVAHGDNCAFMFKSSAGEGSSLSQNGYLAPFADNDTLSVSAYVNASSASINAKIKLVVSYTNTALGKEKVTLPFTVTSGYEEIPNSVTLKSGDVSKIKFNIQNKSTAGKFYVDDVALIWDQAAALQTNPVLALPVGK